MQKQKFIFFTDIFDKENEECLNLFLDEINLNILKDEFIERCGLDNNDKNYIDFFGLLYDDDGEVILYGSYYVCAFKIYKTESTIYYVCSETDDIIKEILKTKSINVTLKEFQEIIQIFYEKLKDTKLPYYIDTESGLEMVHKDKNNSLN